MINFPSAAEVCIPAALLEFELVSAKVTVAASLQIDPEKVLLVSREYYNTRVSDSNLAADEAILFADPQNPEDEAGASPSRARLDQVSIFRRLWL